jgi:DNA modification methylase
MKQLPLFLAVKDVYAESAGSPVDNSTLYREVARRTGIGEDALLRRIPIGRNKSLRSPIARSIRWAQQTLITDGLLQRAEGERAVWQLTHHGRQSLCKIKPGHVLIAFSTDLGLAMWGSAQDVFSILGEPISLCLTSPPYPISRGRAYGKITESEYVDFLCRALEPVIQNLRSGGSVVLNVSNDVFERGMPSRSLYQERLILALHDRFGLHKMDTLIWHNPSKPPGPVWWASINRLQLNVGYEPVLWMTNDPNQVLADNRRVLEPHTARQQQLIRAGGENRHGVYADGAYVVRPGSYSHATPGRIPRNVLTIGHKCQDQARYKKTARDLGLPVHGAPYPLRLVKFLISFLSECGDLVVDPFAGSLTTGRGAEELGRRWVCTDNVCEYLRGGAERFRSHGGFWMNPIFAEATTIR